MWDLRAGRRGREGGTTKKTYLPKLRTRRGYDDVEAAVWRKESGGKGSKESESADDLVGLGAGVDGLQEGVGIRGDVG